jgi:CBS domain-containing protein
MTQILTFPALLQRISVKDIMTPIKNLDIITEQTPIANVLASLKRHGHVWIIQETNPRSLTGVITTTDALTLFATPVGNQEYDKPSLTSLSFGLALTAADIMTAKPFTITPTDTLHTAVMIMTENNITQLPVVDDTNSILGEITGQHLIDRYLTECRKETKT